ncbi:hypothetical protein NSE_0557 [Neorickettsia sennetsu str. Miyayama]|uniref:Uncharacterized protein n=1 Tax=Ehrlichia sennetsu (strain ATCC VR-367 / Miyayama) TaxID=222891 RepID=Q2GDK7_EHRS3|nr:hypothetical protein NSE_0557 [Neorickettsia sennetsu str. Miyayama]
MCASHGALSIFCLGDVCFLCGGVILVRVVQSGEKFYCRK